MLVSFRLANFKSFKEGAELSLIARRSEKTLHGALIGEDLSGLRRVNLLPAAAIYGPNASGKSNFILGLRYLRNAVVQSQTLWRPGAGTKAEANVCNADEPSTFETVIIADGVRYRYGFVATRTHFIDEWLYSYPKGRERFLFRRKTTEHENDWQIDFDLGSSFSGQARDHYSSGRRTRENGLFLSAAAQDNQPEASAVYKWFRSRLYARVNLDFREHQKNLTTAMAYEVPKFKSLLVPLLRMADPSLRDVIISKGEQDRSLPSKEDFARFIEDHQTKFVMQANGGEYTIPYEDQSRGVKRLYNMASGLVSALLTGKTLIVDELESSMHPHVASQLLALFQNRSSNPRGAQLIFTTHETRLLNLQHLRRDQVWFCEKGESGSELYSLLEFAPRKDENFEAGYLRGKYGAVPCAALDPQWIREINNRAGSEEIAEASSA